MPDGQPLTLTRLIRAAGLRWPVEEGFRSGKDTFGLDESQVRLYTAIGRHNVLVMAALAICAITAAQLKHRTDTRAPAPGPAWPAAPRRPRHDPFAVARPPACSLLAHLARRPGHTASGSPSEAATKPSPAGITSAHDWTPGTLTLPRSQPNGYCRTSEAPPLDRQATWLTCVNSGNDRSGRRLTQGPVVKIGRPPPPAAPKSGRGYAAGRATQSGWSGLCLQMWSGRLRRYAAGELD